MPRRLITTRTLLVLACGGATAAGLASAPASGARPLAAGSDPGALVGTWKRVLTQADLDRTASFRVEPQGWETPLVGPQTLLIANGSFTFIDEKSFAVTQTTRVDSGGAFDVLSYIAPEKAAFCPQDIPQNASYTWALEGSDLVLTPTADHCADRDAVLTGRWIPAPKTRTFVAQRTSTRQRKTGFRFTERLSEQGTKAGTDVVTCAYTSKSPTLADCRLTLLLTDGTLVLHAKTDVSKSSSRLPIVSGTVAYAGARGSAIVKQSKTKTVITLHLA